MVFDYKRGGGFLRFLIFLLCSEKEKALQEGFCMYADRRCRLMRGEHLRGTDGSVYSCHAADCFDFDGRRRSGNSAVGSVIRVLEYPLQTYYPDSDDRSQFVENIGNLSFVPGEHGYYGRIEHVGVLIKVLPDNPRLGDIGYIYGEAEKLHIAAGYSARNVIAVVLLGDGDLVLALYALLL